MRILCEALLYLAMAGAGVALSPLLSSPPRHPEHPTCFTACGLELRGTERECQSLQGTETLLLGQLVTRAPSLVRDRKAACAALKGWAVVEHRRSPGEEKTCVPPAWPHGAAGCVVGYTHESTRVLEVQSRDFRHNSTSHELVHALQHAFDVMGHCRWQERGIKAALLAVTDSEDPTPSDCK